MRLTVYKSFEPAVLLRVLRAWEEHVPLFSAIAVQGPALLSWGVQAPLDAGELRAFVVEPAALERLLADGAPALAAGAAGPEPLLIRCPPAGETDQESAAALERLRGSGLRAELIDGLSVARGAGLPDAEIFDPEAQALAQVPYGDGFYLALAGALYRRAWSRLRPAPKVLAIDCDDTLWRGLCAEAGPAGVGIGPEERALHERLLAQKRAGRLLVLVSKNVPADVDAVFEGRPDLALRPADFAARRIGWDPKPQALRELSRELSLGLDSFVFLDDSPAECAAVRAALPEVAVVQRPATGIAALWDAVWPFDLAAAVGALGEARTRLYQEEAQRRDAQRAAPSFAEHVASLRVRCEVRLAGSADEARLFELAQRTNQFNTRAGRPSQEEVRAAVAGGRALAVFVSDRFGDYGLSGAVLLGAPDGDALVAERLLLSCRVLGRGVEETLVEALLARAREAGCAALAVPLDETPRNLPARRFLARHAPGQGGPRLRFAASFGPLQRHFSEQPEDEARAMVRSPAAPDWMEVARLTVDLRRLACAAGLVTDPSLAPVPPRPPAEGEAGVLEVLSEVLERPVRRGDNLYALGADSLRLVRVLARLKSRLGLDLPIGEVVHRADVADLLALAASSAKAAPPEDPGFNALIASLYDDAGDTGA